jgi:hypothetical protein
MAQVIVVPETDEFIHPVSHESEVWINSKLGSPDLAGRNARYLAPYWITEKFRGVNRVYHISNVSKDADGTTIIQLGNSFATGESWDNMGQVRKFEYHDLSDFGFVEIEEGLLKRP